MSASAYPVHDGESWMLELHFTMNGQKRLDALRAKLGIDQPGEIVVQAFTRLKWYTALQIARGDLFCAIGNSFHRFDFAVTKDDDFLAFGSKRKVRYIVPLHINERSKQQLDQLATLMLVTPIEVIWKALILYEWYVKHHLLGYEFSVAKHKVIEPPLVIK